MAYSKTKLLKHSGIALFFITAFFTSILIPTLSASKIGENETETFCDEHNDLCDQDQTWDDSGNPIKVNLLSEVKDSSTFLPMIASVVGGFAVLGFLTLTVLLPKIIDDECRKEKQNDQNNNPKQSNETSPLKNRDKIDYTKSPNLCMRFFRKFKEYVLPTYWDTYLLTAIWASLSATSIIIDWFNASIVKITICATPQPTVDNPNPNYLCENFSEIDDIHAQHELSDLADDVYDAMMWSGSTITLFTSLVFAAAIMTIYAGAKYCTTRNQNKQREHRGQGNEGIDYEHYDHLSI